MKKSFTQVSAVFLIILLLTSILIGCSNDNKKQPTDVLPTEQPKDEATPKPDPEKEDENTLPIVKEPLTLTYWTGFNANQAAVMNNVGESYFAQEAEKRTGIKIEYIHSPIGQENEQFNLMIASREFPDMIQRNWWGYPGGPDKAIEEEVIISLNDLLEAHAPNYMNILRTKEGMEKLVKTDKNTHYVFATIFSEAPQGEVYVGPIVRQDWLDELGIDMPTTMDDWYNMLKAFKEEKNVEMPLTFMLNRLSDSSSFIGAYGVTTGFYQEDGKVHYGPIESGYKEFLTTFEKWYSEGLIDPDFASNDAQTFDAKCTGDLAGAWVGLHNNQIGRYITTVKEKNPDYKPFPAPYPTLKKGDVPKFGHVKSPYLVNASTAITTANKYPVESAKWLDYHYSDGGHMLYNWGEEGVSYVMADGQPQLTDLILNNPEGKPITQIIQKYVDYNGTQVLDYGNRLQAFTIPGIMEAVKIWSEADASKQMPLVTLIPEESDTYTSLMNEIQTYVDEMLLKFIMGVEPLDKFDEYLQQLKKMGVDDVIKIQQTAMDRYNKR